MKNLLFQLAIFGRKFIYLSIHYLDTYILRRKNLITILCYHSISSNGWRFSTPQTEFLKQLEFLQKEYEIISLEDLREFIEGKRKVTKPSVVLTFDDGYQNLVSIKDTLESKKISPAVFLIADTTKANRYELASNLPFLKKNEILSLQRSGWILGNHSLTHADFSNLDEANLKKEIVDSKKKLESDLGTTISYLAYPKGAYTSEVLETVKKTKYELAFSMDDGFITTQSNRFILPRVGVDGTHSFNEFKALMLPSAIYFRNFIKKTFIAKWL